MLKYTHLPAEAVRVAVAAATHEVITRETGTGIGLCLLYAYIGAIAASVETNTTYAVQVGSLTVRLNDEGKCLRMDARSGGLREMEYHAWFAAEHPNGRYEVVDLSSRFYRQWATDLGLEWRRPDPPESLWTWHTRLSEHGVMLEADPKATMEAQAHVWGDLGDTVRRLGRAAVGRARAMLRRR